MQLVEQTTPERLSEGAVPHCVRSCGLVQRGEPVLESISSC